MNYNNMLLEKRQSVALVRLHRPKVYNALNCELMDELSHALAMLEADTGIRVIVLTGSDKAFAAGADISEVRQLDFSRAYREGFVSSNWEAVTRCRKPVIAAVAGLALGGGCELAMMCDMIIAADTARFGQPEVKVGTLPGAGGTQRLARAIGKAKTMDLCLTGRTMDAEEAERSGLVSRVVPADELLERAMAVAAEIADHSLMATMLNKDAVDQAFETSLKAGVDYERRLLWASFASADRDEGMGAFLEKRQPDWTHR